MRRFFIAAIITICAFQADMSAQKVKRAKASESMEKTEKAEKKKQKKNNRNLSGGRVTGYEIIDGDTVAVVTINPVYVFTKPKDMRQYERLVRNVKKVYPYAQDARRYMEILETELVKLETQKERDQFTKQMEKELVKKYTPILENMTYSQGKILIKLIDRETSRTSYEIIQEFRGNFSATFWNMIAKVFKADLKQGYDKDGEDKLIEQIIILYEAGLL